MHKLVLKFFEILKQTIYFIQILCVFLVFMTVLYWIQNLIGANWGWMDFIKVTLDSILALSNLMCPIEWKTAAVNIEVKYLVAIILLMTLAFLSGKLSYWMDDLRRTYENVRIDCKKINEKFVNRNLQNAQKKEELKLTKYCIYIKTRLDKKFVNLSDSDLEDQNKQMTDFIFSKIHLEYTNFKDGFLYSFNDFSRIDNILEVMFKVLHARSRLNYLICVQIGYDLKQISKLAELNNYGKITMAADTAYRYSFNQLTKYATDMVGVYQNIDGTIEVHEFREKEII